MQKLLILSLVSCYFIFQGYLAGCLFDDDSSPREFIQLIKQKASLSEIIIFGPALLLTLLVKLSGIK